MKKRVYPAPNITATGIIASYSKDLEPKKPFVASLNHFSKNRIIVMLLGIPFGEGFIPGRVFLDHQSNRYDPHNFIFAMLYRTGIIGLMIFLTMTFRIMRKAYLVAKETDWILQKDMILGSLLCLVYHMAHSLTDVTLENPFKGGPYWFFLGMLIVLSGLKKDNQGPEAVSNPISKGNLLIER